MANRYWVGGNGTWNSTNTTNWSATSGGAGGASVPTSADDVFFTNLSTGTCTIASDTGAKSITCTGFTGTITGTANMTVYGSITLVSGMAYTHTGTIIIGATSTITSAGKAFSGVNINGAGITVQLSGALNCSNRSVTLTSGTFDTQGFSLTCGSILLSSSVAKTLTLGASTVTVSGSAGISYTGTNLTLNAGTSQITLSSSSANLAASGLTFYNVSFTGSTGSDRFITGSNTFNNLSITASSTGVNPITVTGNQTINGTLTCDGTSAIARGFIRSNIVGTTRTLTCNAISANDCDFRDITLAGSAAGASPTRAGDGGGNSGITFPSPKTVYRVGTLTGWSGGTTSWATTSGGTGSDVNFPLAQDTAVIDQNTALTGTLSLANIYNVGSIDCSTRTTGITLNFSASQYIYGSITLGSGITISGTGTSTFYGTGTQTFTSAGKTITFPIAVEKASGSFQLGDAYTTTASAGITLTSGTFDAVTYNVTSIIFSSNNSNTRTINMGSGLWTLSGIGTVWTTNNANNLTLNKGTANILLSNDGVTVSRVVLLGTIGNATSYNKITIGGTGGFTTTTISHTGVIDELASTKTVAHTLSIISLGTINTWSVKGSSGNTVQLQSSVSGTARSVALTNVTSGIDYLGVKDINCTTPNKFYVGANSPDNGNNTNVYFTDAPAPSTSNSNFFLLFA